MNRFAFLSDGWLDAMEQVAQRLLDERPTAPGAPFRYAEMFTAIPADLVDTIPAGYVLTFADGRVTVGKATSTAEAADCTVRIGYAAALSTMRFVSGPAFDAVIRRAFSDGSMTISGSAGDIPIDMGKLHDALFDQTETPAG